MGTGMPSYVGGDGECGDLRTEQAETSTIPVAALVLCPLRRDEAVGYYAATAGQLIGAGIHEVQRFQGYDLTKEVKHARGCTSRRVIMKAFEDIFLPRARKILDDNPNYKFVLFVEDDMSFQAGVGRQELLEALGDARSSAATWLGCVALHLHLPEPLPRGSQTVLALNEGYLGAESPSNRRHPPNNGHRRRQA